MQRKLYLMWMRISDFFQIKPLSGPIEGGTLVTIEGSNLGLKEEDVRGKISIGSTPCELIYYEVSVKITCRTGASDGETEAPIYVGNDAGITESSVCFRYKVGFFYICVCTNLFLLTYVCIKFKN